MRPQRTVLLMTICGLLVLGGCGLAPGGAAAVIVLLLISLGLAAGCYRSTDGPQPDVIQDPGIPETALPDAAHPDADLQDADLADLQEAVLPPCGGGTCPDHMTCVDSPDRGPWCFPDADEDGRWDGDDNCPYLINPEQQDSEGDGYGDGCDLCDGEPNGPTCVPEEFCCHDPDGDGVPGLDAWPSLYPDRDNCPYIYNPYQEDTDEDGVGDACDLCPEEPNPLSPCGDPCLDSDRDGVPDFDYCVTDVIDACPLTPSDNRSDTDLDGVDDVCDPDGVPPIQEGGGGLVTRSEGFSPGRREEVRRTILARLQAEGILDEETALTALRLARRSARIG